MKKKDLKEALETINLPKTILTPIDPEKIITNLKIVL